VSADDTGIGYDFTIRDSSASGERVIRQLILGHHPLVLIEPEYDEDADDVRFTVDATDLDLESLRLVLQGVVAAIEQAESKDEQ
jgi:hypothetical protein